jgi:hypothetical protein
VFGLHRRDLGEDQHDKDSWTMRGGRALGRKGTARALEDADLRCHPTVRWADPACVLDGPINGASFLAYVTQFLVPTLQSGDDVVIANLGSH